MNFYRNRLLISIVLTSGFVFGQQLAGLEDVVSVAENVQSDEVIDCGKQWINHTQKLIESQQMHYINSWSVRELFILVSQEHYPQTAYEVLEKFFPYLSTKSIMYLIAKLSSEFEKSMYLKKLLETTSHEQVDLWKFKNALKHLSDQERDDLINILMETFFDALTDTQITAVITYLSEEKKEKYLAKLITKNSFVAACSDRSVKGPLFSQYTTKHISTILNCIYSAYATEFRALENTSVKMKKLEQLFNKLVQFTAQEYKKGNIVLYHGQQSQWPFLELLFNELCIIRYGIPAPHDFVRLRFTKKALLTDDEVTHIRTHGITYHTFDKYRFKVLFSNLHVLANYRGSNSFLYVATNLDQTVYYNRFPFKEGIQDLFTEFRLSDVYDFLIQEDQDVFVKLYELYNAAIKADGNIGRLIAISIPTELAKKITYSTRSGAGLNPIFINGNFTTDVVEIAQHFDQVPFENEYCVIISKEISSPAQAYKAQIKMMSCDGVDQTSETWITFKNQMKIFSEFVLQKHKEPRPDFLEKLYNNIQKCVGKLIVRVM